MPDPVDLRHERAKRQRPIDEGPDYWSCNCGCVVFYYRHDDTLECVDCGTLQHGWKPEDRE